MSKGHDQAQQAFGGFEDMVDFGMKGKLQGKFLMPPFSVLDTRQGYWQQRKKQWMSLGIQSEVGRGENLLKFSEGVIFRKKRENSLLFKSLSGSTPNYYTQKNETEAKLGHKISNIEFEDNYLEVSGRIATGTSVFDPALCELMYKWFCPENGTILDPFAGGSVRGIVASMLGYDYHGIDLATEQLEANREQAQKICTDHIPVWFQGDSNKMDDILPKGKFYDLIFSCPPYHDLEKYGDDSNDLCNMSWQDFKRIYAEIIAKAVLKLNYCRFAVFVVSEIRNEEGFYKGLVPWTIETFKQAGATFYNELILVNTVGSLALRIGIQFGKFRKVGRTHQNILVFYKGDIRTMPLFFKEIDIGMPKVSEWGSNSDPGLDNELSGDAGFPTESLP